LRTQYSLNEIDQRALSAAEAGREIGVAAAFIAGQGGISAEWARPAPLIARLYGNQPFGRLVLFDPIYQRVEHLIDRRLGRIAAAAMSDAGEHEELES